MTAGRAVPRGPQPQPRLTPGTRPVVERTRAGIEELFFDLVFVFAFLQVTKLVMDDFTALGMLDGLLVVALLWWSWSCFAWLGNNVQADWGLPRIGVLAATVVMLLLALAAGEAFTDRPGGLNGPLVFASSYLALRLIHLAVHAYAVTRKLRLLLVAVPAIIGSGLLFSAALIPQHLVHQPQQIRLLRTGLWILAVLVDYVGSLALPHWEWGVFSARHWAERHGQIIIIALGESVIAIGLTAARVAVSIRPLATAALGILVVAAVQFLYFDIVALSGEQVVRDAAQPARLSLARDAYSYLHLVMIAAIVLLALALKIVTLATTTQTLGRPLTGLGLFSLYGAVVLYLAGNVGFQWRIRHGLRTIVWAKVVAIPALVILGLAAQHMPAMAALGLLAAASVVLVIVEIIIADGQRKRLREAVLSKEP